MKLEIRHTNYGPTIYMGRKKIEGPFLNQWTAQGRMETLQEREDANNPNGVGALNSGKIHFCAKCGFGVASHMHS